MDGISRRATLAGSVVAGLLTLALAAPAAGAHHRDGHEGGSPEQGQSAEHRSDEPKPAQADNGRGETPAPEKRERKQQPPAGSGGIGNGAENGNPGTIKVAAIGDGTANDNEPHPGCAARIDFYNFNPKTYDVTFTAIAPTAGGVVGGGPATVTAPRTGGGDFQQSFTYSLDLSGLTPAAQGFHIKVEVTNPDKPGNGAKSKVFWIDCVPAPAATESASVLGERAAAGSEEASVLGVRYERSVAPAAESAAEPAAEVRAAKSSRPGVLAFTGSRTFAFVLAAALLLAVGTALVVLSRRSASASTLG